MSVQMAAKYVGVSQNTFLALGIPSFHVGRRVLWDIHSVDAFLDGMSGVPLDGRERDRAQAAVEEAFLKRRRGA